jgi:hypothetical protein
MLSRLYKAHATAQRRDFTLQLIIGISVGFSGHLSRGFAFASQTPFHVGVLSGLTNNLLLQTILQKIIGKKIAKDNLELLCSDLVAYGLAHLLALFLHLPVLLLALLLSLASGLSNLGILLQFIGLSAFSFTLFFFVS